jgi:hypothetical protein
MSEIKRRRLEELEVDCHPGTKVGAYVPFYLCPRSMMLFLLHKGNHVDLTYTGGQRPIVHLQADLRRVVEWAESEGGDGRSVMVTRELVTRSFSMTLRS